MSTIIIGDVAEGQKWWGQVEFMKQQLAANHRANNAYMSTWKQLTANVKVFINMVAGKPRAFIYVGGDLVAWGWNAFGQLGLSGLGVFNAPVAVPFVKAAQIVKISCVRSSTAILCSDNSLYVFGRNNFGQLGLGDNDDRLTPTLLGTDFADVAISSHLLAVKTNGDLYSSGSNYYGQLGLGDTTDRNELTLVGSGYSKVSVNTYHSLAITDAGDLYTFGKNNALDNANPANGSMLGTGDLVEQHAPVFIDSGFSDISAGQLHSLAIKTNGDLYSTGCNVGGTLGVGDYIGRLTFTFIDGPYTYISAGRDANLAIYDGFYAMAWGLNTYGRLGLGDPTVVPNAVAPTIVGEGCVKCAINSEGNNSMVLTDLGEVYTSGWNVSGELGQGLATGYPPGYPTTLVVNTNEFTLVGPGYKYIACGGAFENPSSFYSSCFAVKGQLSVAP